MSDTKITRDVYKQYAHKIASVLDNEEFYEQFKERVDNGASSFKLGKKRLIQDISIDWISTIEEILPNLDTIVRNPRRFIVQEEDIVDVSLARSISTESVKFLAQHTNMISKVEDDGSVIPSKILNITKEESFEIYENRFIYTLLLKLKDFVTMRYDKIKRASATQDVLELDVESRFNLPSKKVTYRTEYFAQLSFDEVMRLDPDTLTKIERVAKIDRIITDFLSSSFAKSMRNSAPVRPPIMRTNVILKEPNFKKALVLWQFIETYNQTAGFSTTDDVEEIPLENASIENLRNMVTLNTMLFESMYEEYETDMNMEDKQFADFLRVGEMDFEKDKIDRDQYAQKLEEKIENEEEEQKVEEVKAQEEEQAETEMPPEPEEKPQIEENQVVQEEEIEKPVEVERYKEMPPKADQEEVDLEPDAEKFDQHLFDVRKLYKRPDDDKLKQEDIVKVRDAIDRCLTSYRRIKQEEIDERDRQDRIRRRREDMAKRAASFSKQREELSKSVDNLDSSTVYFGIDPFSYQKAKLAAEKKEEELKKALRPDDDNLQLEGDAENIAKEIDEMEIKRGDRPAPADSESVETPQEEQDAAPAEVKRPAKGKIRLSKNTEPVDPWEKKKTPQKDIVPVDENKVQVGGIHFADGSDVENPFGELLGSTSNKAENRAERSPRQEVKEEGVGEQNATDNNVEEPKPPVKKKRGGRKKKVADETSTAAEGENKDTAEGESAAEGEKKSKPKKRAAGELSPTTTNQKYSKPSGKPKNLQAVDESKVAVGGISFAKGSGISDPFNMNPFADLSNKAESAGEESDETPDDNGSGEDDK